YGHIEQRRIYRIGEQDARTHEHPNHTDLRQSGRTQIERGYAEPTGAHGIGKLIRPPFTQEPLKFSIFVRDSAFVLSLLYCFKRPKIDSYARHLDRKSTRLNSSHVKISYAVFCLK